MSDAAAISVARIMVKPVVIASPSKSVAAARRVMREWGIRHLPVLDEEKLLVGIVSERDLRDAREVAPLSELMRSPVHVLSPDMPLLQAIRVFRRRRVGAMPVLEGRELVGIVSVVDVLSALSA